MSEADVRRMQRAALYGVVCAFTQLFSQSEYARQAIREAAASTDQYVIHEQRGRRATRRFSVYCSNDLLDWMIHFKDPAFGWLHIVLFDFSQSSSLTFAWRSGGDIVKDNIIDPEVSTPVVDEELFARLLAAVRHELRVYLKAVKAPIKGVAGRILE